MNEDIQETIVRINKGYAELKKIREDLGVKPGESLLRAMGLPPIGNHGRLHGDR